MSVYRVIDKMEIVVREGIWLPFGWRAVNSDQVLDLIEKLRSTLPDDGARARKSSDGFDRSADEIAAEDRVNLSSQTVDIKSTAPGGSAATAPPGSAMQESDIVARAQARAESIVADAQAAARDIRRGADEYADHVLVSLDASLAKALAAVQKGRQALATSAMPSNGKTPREMSSQ